MYITRRKLLATFDDDAAFVNDIVSSFLERSVALLAAIEAGIAAGDPEAASRAAHSLKGAIGYFEHGDIYATAAAIERLQSAAELAEAPTLLRSLTAGVAELSRHLTEVLHAA